MQPQIIQQIKRTGNALVCIPCWNIYTFYMLHFCLLFLYPYYDAPCLTGNKYLLRRRLFFSTLYKTHEPRTRVLYCPLSRTVRSLMACEKQMSAMQTLVFLYAHNIPEKALHFHIFTDSKSVQIPHRRELHLPLFPFRKRYATAAQYLKIWRLPSRHF